MEANEAAAATVLSGWPDRTTQPRFEELWPPSMVAKVKPPILEVARGGAPYVGEVVLRDGSNIRRAFRARAFSVPGRRVVVAFEETTRERIAEDALARSEAQYRHLVEDLSDVVYTTDASGAVTYVSPAVAVVLGYQPEEVLGRSYLDFAAPGALPTLAELGRMLADRPPARPLDYPLHAKDGRMVWVRVSGHVVFDSDGEPAGMHGVFGDITEARRAAEALEQARRDKDLVLNATNDYLAYYAPDQTVRWVNRAAARQIGRSEGDIIGRPCYEVWNCVSHGDGDCAVQRVERTLEPQESRMRSATGRSFVVRAYPAFEEGQLVGIVESIVDITASERAREERVQMEAQLRQSQKLESIGTLASGIAHEVNNPLTGMINYAELISRRVGDSHLREYAEGIQAEGARVASIVRGLLSFARKDPGTTAAVAPRTLVETTLLLIRSVIEREGIALEVDVPDALPPVECRPQQIEQVLLNLLTNARDAVAERFAEPGAERRIVLRGACVDIAGVPFVRLTVQDNGVGIPEEIRDRVFDPFFTTKPRDRGTGLGLSISYGIVRDHGGRLWFDRKAPEGGGAVVHVDLPSSGSEPSAGPRSESGGGS